MDRAHTHQPVTRDHRPSEPPVQDQLLCLEPKTISRDRLEAVFELFRELNKIPFYREYQSALARHVMRANN